MSSAGGSRPAPGLLPETSVTDLEVAWKEREEEARELTVPGFHSMALSMRLYSLEIRLKTHICRLLKLSHLPRVCKTHDLSELIIFTGMWEELENPANGNTQAKLGLTCGLQQATIKRPEVPPTRDA